MSSSAHPLPPVPPEPAAPQGSTVRRHHTITAPSRSARAQGKEIISEELPGEDAPWKDDDEPVDHDWVGGVGAVGEKTSLHRQSSLPTRYHRGSYGKHGANAANMAPKPAINSLVAIAGHEGDEDWDITQFRVHEDEHNVDAAQQQLDPQATNSPLGSHFNQTHTPSPPPSGANVRRHVSLTYGAAVGGPRKVNSGLKRSGTLQATHHSHSSNASETSDYKEGPDYSYDQDDTGSNQSHQSHQGHQSSGYSLEEEAYLRQQQQQYSASINRSQPWNQTSDWRTTGNTTTIDDVTRALSTLEMAGATGGYNNAAVGQYSQPTQPPRFSGTPSRASNNGNGGNIIGGNGNRTPGDYDGRRTPSRGQNTANWQQQQQQQQRGDWDQGQHQLGGRRSNTNLNYGFKQNDVPVVPSIPSHYLQQTQQAYGQQQQSSRPGLGIATNFASGGNVHGSNSSSGQTPIQPYVATPIDVPSLIASKGYNPSTFDTKPPFARYFVIKSYTEDDVHKSLKYEIWSSTEPGNKRLDKAFKDTAGRGPIYLFFSVNASGHFCGMAEMLTPVDYTRSSTVWASDKWKGVFKVRWIFVRDIPNSNLRHIKLNNTQERKPVTNSRDTQELLPDAGQEMLRIFYTHPARTSLLQDFAFYELQAMQKVQGPANPGVPGMLNNNSPPNQSSAVQSPQISHASIPSSASSTSSHHSNSGSFSSNAGYSQGSGGYGMNPMMQMGMGIGGMGGMGITAPPGNGMGMGMGGGMGMGNMGLGGMSGGQYGVNQAVMRHASPAPSQGQGGQGNQGQGYGY